MFEKRPLLREFVVGDVIGIARFRPLGRKLRGQCTHELGKWDEALAHPLLVFRRQLAAHVLQHFVERRRLEARALFGIQRLIDRSPF